MSVTETLNKANSLIKQGYEVHFKFTCAHCGMRQTFEIPNTFFGKGSCEECGQITNLLDEKAKVNFVALLNFPKGHGSLCKLLL